MTGSTFFILFLIAESSVCGIVIQKSSLSNNNPHLGIYDGNNTTIEKHPYQVGVLVINTLICAATIVSKGWVISPAYYVYEVKPEILGVVAGSNDGRTGQRYSVDQVVIHPKFVQSSLEYDYALIKINDTFHWSSKMQAARLSLRCPQPGTQLFVAGWGYTNGKAVSMHDSNGNFKEGTLTLQEQKVCTDAYSGEGYNFNDTMTCAYNKGKTSLCMGDMGDGLVVPTTKGSHVVYTLYYMSIYVDGSGSCSSSAKPGIIANICSVAPWVKKTARGKLYDKH